LNSQLLKEAVIQPSQYSAEQNPTGSVHVQQHVVVGDLAGQCQGERVYLEVAVVQQQLWNLSEESIDQAQE